MGSALSSRMFAHLHKCTCGTIDAITSKVIHKSKQTSLSLSVSIQANRIGTGESNMGYAAPQLTPGYRVAPSSPRGINKPWASRFATSSVRAMPLFSLLHSD